MNMKEHLEKLRQEQESGVTLTAEEANSRRKALLMDAQIIVASHILVAKLLMETVKSIPDAIKAEHEASNHCIDIIAQMQHGDVNAE